MKRLAAALLFLVACRGERVARDATPQSTSLDASPNASSAPSASSSAAAEAPSTPTEAPWIQHGAYGASDELTESHPTRHVGGIVVQPTIELPTNVPPEVDPVMSFRVRGLPAISADGQRVAYVYSPMKCCRFNRPYWDLWIVDAHTGVTLEKLPLTHEDDDMKRIEATLATRTQKANAKLAGEWITLGTIDGGASGFHGEGVSFAPEERDEQFKPFDVRRDDGHVTHVVTAGWKIKLGNFCPPDRYTMTIVRAWGARGKLVLLDVDEDDGPDGCETSSLQLVRID